MDDSGYVIVHPQGNRMLSVVVLRVAPHGWAARIRGLEDMPPFPTQLEAVTFAEEWLNGELRGARSSGNQLDYRGLADREAQLERNLTEAIDAKVVQELDDMLDR